MEASSPKPSKFNLDLHIPDLHSFVKENVEVTSVIGRHHFLAWKLCCDTHTHPGDGKTYLSVFIQCDNKCTDWIWDCRAKYKISLKNFNPNGEDRSKTSEETMFTNKSEDRIWKGYFQFHPLEKVMDPQNGFLVGGGIRIHADVTAQPPNGLHLVEKSLLRSIFAFNNKATTAGHILRLFKSGEGANFVVVAGDNVEFKVHRGILGSKSDFFDKMFKADMAEANTGRVKLEDMNGTSCRALLRFMYTGDFSRIETLELPEVEQLINAGEKYGLPELKKYCGYLLVERVSRKKALRAYKFAKQYGLGDAQKDILKFCKDNLSDVFDNLAQNASMDTSSTSEDEEESDEEDDKMEEDVAI